MSDESDTTDSNRPIPEPVGAGEARTVFMPPTARSTGAPDPPSPASGRVEVGAVLNGIYEVKRFIARGGMGEVYEGVNVNDDHDRVAIKVILPALAADPDVQAMFRKEARVLTRLTHPALVQYRVLAQEPRLGVFYIVTEFIDGEQLSEMLDRLRPTSLELRGFVRRMAEGLRVAHALGAVHRDISPDNVLLPGGVLDWAKIIDFGIAKDLDTSNKTIIGDGFAGKLGYVAPEQFGDFGREIGPWTDVYSLGLLIISLATGRNVDMGATLVEAVDRRRAGPDLSPVPEDLRPLLASMTTAHPAHRARSMDEVLAWLDRAAAPSSPIPSAKRPPEKPARRAVGAEAPPKPTRTGLWPFVLAGLVALVSIGAAVLLLLPKTPSSNSGVASTSATKPSVAPATRVETARRVIESALPSVPCSWLDIESLSPSGGGVAVTLNGVAVSTQGAGAISQAAKATGVDIANLDLQGVAPIDSGICSTLDAFRPIRSDTSVSGHKLVTAQPIYTLQKHPDGTLSEPAVITMAIGDPSLDFVLLGLDPTGGLTVLVPSRKWFDSKVDDPRHQSPIAALGNDTYRLDINMSPPVGMQGLLLTYGRGPLDTHLGHGPATSAAGVANAAKAAGWKAEMVWYKIVAPSG